MKEHEINKYWRRILDTMNDGLVLIDPEGSILVVNQAFEELTGYRADEVIGRPCTLLECDACDQELRRGNGNWCSLFEIGSKKKCRCNILKKDGSCLPIIKNASVLRDEKGEVLGAVETLADMSEVTKLDREINQLSQQLEVEGGFHGILGKSKVIRETIELIVKAAVSDSPVIIYGESGTGKELVARAIHLEGNRKNGPFVQLNCAALNESLIESELFGHVKGSFTGACQHREGRFEAAHDGDLFLDEIGDMPRSIQTKLLRVLESKKIERVGENRSIPVDVRIITATNKDLYDLIAKRRFREDFFFRISVIPIHLPPLRERASDIPVLVNTFIYRLKNKTGKQITGLSPKALERVMSYSWPGNIRELKSALEYAFVIASQGRIKTEHLPPQIVNGGGTIGWKGAVESPLASAERESLIEALRIANGNQSQAARLLGVSRVTVWNRINKYNIDLKRYRVG